MKEPAWLKRSLVRAAASALLCVPGAASASDVAAVLSSDSGPYREAYSAFKGVMTGEVDFVDVSARDFKLPDDIHFVAAFGAKAAAVKYPPGTHLVYALTPVVSANPHWLQISMAPHPGEALAAYKGLQPDLKRLAVFWSAYPGEAYMEALRSEGEKAGIEVISARLKSPDSLPERLRRLMGGMDAFWLMPDPALITQDSLMVLATFSCANAIPFYAPTTALVQSGATAAYSQDFRAAGEAAAEAIAGLKQGKSLYGVIYAGKGSLSVNEALRGKCRWRLR